MKPSLFILALLGLAPQIAFSQMVIRNYTDATNDRYNNNASFALSGFDLSGVGQASNGRWATLIGTNTIISANHFAPSGTITFSSSNSTTDSFTRTINSANNTRIAGTDLWVTSLTQAVPASTTIYSFDTTTLTANSTANIFGTNYNVSTSLNGTDTYMTGRSPATNPNNFDQAYGTNRIDTTIIQANPAGLGTGDYIQLNNDTFFNVTTYEAGAVVGDSGAPLFVDNGSGGLTLYGVNSFVGQDGSGNTTSTFVSHTGRYETQLNNAITNFAAQIPEPSSALLCGLAGFSFLLHRRR